MLELTSDRQRALGAFYTPRSTAEFMAAWALRQSGDVVLEPSMGDGVFIRALHQVAEREGLSGVSTVGVDIDPAAHRSVIEDGLLTDGQAILADFLDVTPFMVDAVIGNPPYVRLRHLPQAQASKSLASASNLMSDGLDPAASLWMPIILHSLRFLRPEGRIAFVLPYDLTYVRYARPLWSLLASRFTRLRIVRARERFFDDLMQEAVLFLADGFGGTTTTVGYHVFERVSDILQGGAALSAESIPIHRIVEGERPFVEALLPRDVRAIVESADQISTLGEHADVRIGYVCGDKEFFHPSKDTVEKFHLPRSCLTPSVASSREVIGIGVRTSNLPVERKRNLFLPSSSELSVAERQYIEKGERVGVHRRYKCRIRSPWYVTPYVRVPELIIPVFSEYPLVLHNDARLAASNSLVCAFLHNADAAEVIVASWYNSLTLLHIELLVHSLGGGVMIVVPREAAAIPIPRVGPDVPITDLLNGADRRLREKRVADAYQTGDEEILQRGLGLTSGDVDALRGAREILRKWRSGRRGSPEASVEVIDKKIAISML